MAIELDTHRCIGAAMCVLHAPGVFTQDEGGVVALLPGGALRDEEPEVSEAAQACPVQAIGLR